MRLFSEYSRSGTETSQSDKVNNNVASALSNILLFFVHTCGVSGDQCVKTSCFSLCKLNGYV